MKLLIKNGRVIDPESGTDEILDVLVVGGAIAEIKAGIETSADNIVDAAGLVVAPGFIDMHVHLREPGYEEKETIETGSRAAAKGGFATICCMPNTNPVNDTPAVTASIIAASRKTRLVNVLPVAAVTRGLRGTDLTDMDDLLKAGAVAFSDDGQPVASNMIMKHALERARSLEALIIDHCEDKSLTSGGLMHEGPYSRLFGFQGMPAAAEEIMVARDIILAEMTGARLHVAHLSALGAVRAVQEAKARGRIRISAEATPHHLLLNDSLLRESDTNFKMNPPLRGQADVDALIEAVRTGVVDVIATDHAPHTVEDKSVEFAKAPFGVIGLETAVPVLLDKLVHTNILPLPRFIALFSANPARLLGLGAKGRIAVGADADMTFLNLHKETVMDSHRFESKSRNTPFEGWKLKGLPVMTVVNGRIVYPFESGPDPTRTT